MCRCGCLAARQNEDTQEQCILKCITSQWKRCVFSCIAAKLQYSVPLGKHDLGFCPVQFKILPMAHLACFDASDVLTLFAQILKMSWVTTKMPIMSNCGPLQCAGGPWRDHKCTRLRPSEWVAEVADAPELTVQTEKQVLKKVRCGYEIAKRVTHASTSRKRLQIKKEKKKTGSKARWHLCCQEARAFYLFF